MGNPFFKSMGGNAPQGNMLSMFPKFMNQMKGQNSDAMLNELLSSGRVNQTMLNTAQQQAQKVMGLLDGIKNMFGF